MLRFMKLFSVGYKWLNMPFLRDTLSILLNFSTWSPCNFACFLYFLLKSLIFIFLCLNSFNLGFNNSAFSLMDLRSLMSFLFNIYVYINPHFKM